jgi:protein-S-isoprenylcysteine O-methyltransferase Ste14
MKWKSMLYGILIALSLFIGGPLLFIFLNIKFSLPITKIPGSTIIGIILVIFSAISYVYCIFIFIKDGNGTLTCVQPAQKLIVNKIYAYVRNPIYILHLLFFLGVAFLFKYLLLFIYCIILIPFYAIKVRYFEEPKLLERFGTDYQIYMKKTPRWFIKIGNKAN